MWETFGQLAALHNQQDLAVLRGDIEAYRRLLDREAVVWERVRSAIAGSAGEAKKTEDLVMRLQHVIHLRRARQQAKMSGRADARRSARPQQRRG